jgi:RNA polymerase sporulation-specific sigma factor
LPYESWMDDARVDVQRDECGCGEIQLMDKLEETGEQEEKVLNQMLLMQLLEGLEKEERQLIYLRYFANQTQSQVGKTLGISQVQVSRLEKKILKNLRQKV